MSREILKEYSGNKPGVLIGTISKLGKYRVCIEDVKVFKPCRPLLIFVDKFSHIWVKTDIALRNYKRGMKVQFVFRSYKYKRRDGSKSWGVCERRNNKDLIDYFVVYPRNEL